MVAKTSYEWQSCDEWDVLESGLISASVVRIVSTAAVST